MSIDVVEIISVGGSLASALGVFFAIHQINRTKSAVEAGEEASERLRNRLSKEEIIRTLQSADLNCQFVQRELDTGNWNSACEKIEEARISLMRMHKHWNAISEDQLKDVPHICSKLGNFRLGILHKKGSQISHKLNTEIRNGIYDVRFNIADWQSKFEHINQ